jgi:hypothetical protein
LFLLLAVVLALWAALLAADWMSVGTYAVLFPLALSALAAGILLDPLVGRVQRRQ